MSFELLNNYTKQKPPVGATINWNHPISRGLIGCWLMNEGGGTLVRDIASRNDGQLSGGAKWATGGNGCAVEFDPASNVGGIIKCNNNAKFNNLRNFSIIASTNSFDSVGNSGRIVDKMEINGTLRGWAFINGAFFLTAGGDTNEPENDVAPNSYKLNQFNQVGVTYNGGAIGTTVDINGIVHYYNGILANMSGGFSSVGTQPRDNDDQSGICIGNRPNTQRNFNGRIEYVFMWNRVLRREEIAQLYVTPYIFITPNYLPVNINSIAVTAVFRKTLSGLGSRVGSRQVHAWSN